LKGLASRQRWVYPKKSSSYVVTSAKWKSMLALLVSLTWMCFNASLVRMTRYLRVNPLLIIS
jgi:hypothetical protein